VCALSTMGCGVGVAYWLDVVYAGFVDISCWSGGGCCVERLGEVWGSARDITYVVLTPFTSSVCRRGGACESATRVAMFAVCCACSRRCM
jgi:hypothetical protein